MTLSLLQLPVSYLIWHYTTAWGDLFRLYWNFTWFLWNFFSIRLLSHTLLSPWHRLHEGEKKAVGGFLGNFIINVILRCIGFFARLVTILTGLVAIVLFSAFFLLFLPLWLCMPLVPIIFVVNGLVGLFTF